MPWWPEPERTRVPEGHYDFRLNKEPEVIKFTYHDKNGNEKDSKKLKLFAVAFGQGGLFPVVDVFLPWEDRYTDLCKALDVEHGKDIVMEGATFEADIKYVADRKDATKSWPRIVNIVTGDEKPEKVEGGDDIPF